MEVLVTGGDTELGRSVAGTFRDAGHRVVVSGGRRDELEVTAKELDVDAIVVDNSAPAALTQARSEFPQHLDTIVNVPAARWTEGDPRAFTPDQTAAAWRNAMDAVVLAPVLTMQAIGDHLRSGGSVISVVPECPPLGGPEAAVKAALADWTAGQADHFGTRGITINVVAVGHGVDPGYPGLTGTEPAVAAEISRMTLFLTTPAARHITGQTLHVSAGALRHFG